MCATHVWEKKKTMEGEKTALKKKSPGVTERRAGELWQLCKLAQRFKLLKTK